MTEADKFDLLTYFEIINRRKVTLILQGLLLLATSLIGGLLLFRGHNTPGQILLAFSVILIILLLLNLRGNYKASLIGLVWVSPVMLTLLMIEGEGLHDPGMAGFSLYVIAATLLMGKRYLPIAYGISIGMVAFIYISENAQLFSWTFDMRYTASFIDLITALVMLSIITAVLWIVMDIIEVTINKLITGEHQIKEAYDLTLEGWSRALEMRDKETRGHSRRVTLLTLKIGQRMGIPQEKLHHFRRGALLHDIGKMAIPDVILHKPGSLDEKEWKVIKKHPDYAYEMLKDIDFLEPALEIPLFHHERWDGQGYPKGLSGEEIPLAARIFAVVDNWDALNSNRPYRSAWNQEDVISYINQESGKKFDPQIVSIFLAIIRADYTMC
ncbi:MAG: HD-GYP domain-containing protein [Anaerolineales bacterium]|nr:HD-GYP domain-containing protein [Anaerolineales bacterium]